MKTTKKNSYFNVFKTIQVAKLLIYDFLFFNTTYTEDTRYLCTVVVPVKVAGIDVQTLSRAGLNVFGLLPSYYGGSSFY